MLWVINLEDVDKRNFRTYFTGDPGYKREIKVGRCVYHYDQEFKERWDKHNDKTIHFRWTHPRRNWFHANRYLFFDFGDDYLFLVQEWKDQSYGIGRWVHKKDFVKKHGGDITKLNLKKIGDSQAEEIQTKEIPVRAIQNIGIQGELFS
jgi:hypothetical protein